MRVMLVPVDCGEVLPTDVSGVITLRDVLGAQVRVGEWGHHVSRSWLGLRKKTMTCKKYA